MQLMDRLFKLVRHEKVTLCIGAGFSIEAGAPSVAQLKQAILDCIDDLEIKAAHERDSLSKLSEFFVEEICSGSRNELIQILHKAFEFTPKCMDDHEMLAKIPHFHSIITTNYDTLLEDSYQLKDRDVVRNDTDCAYMNKSVRIYKIHGDLTAPDSIVITDSDYKAFFKNPNTYQFRNAINNEFLTKNIVFIGYSLEDDNILKMLREISKSIKRNQKDMFLIAPNIAKSRIAQLKKMKITYIDAYAKDFLNGLMTELVSHISADFQHKNILPETYTKFCNLHGFNPEITISPDGYNQIGDVKPLSGKGIKQVIQFTVRPQQKDMFDNLDFDKMGEIIPGSPFGDIPMIQFKDENLLKCTYLVNDVVLNDKFKSCSIGPTVNENPLTIKVPSRNFIERVNSTSYRVNNNTARIIVDCDLFKMTLKVIIEEHENHNSLNVTFNFDFKKTYTNNNEAIKWIELVDAFFSGEDVELSPLFSKKFNISENLGGKIPKHPFKQHKRYYENIKQIELNTNTSFKAYDEFSDERLAISDKIVAYLKHTPIRIGCSNGFDFAIVDYSDSTLYKQEEVGSQISMVLTENEGEKLVLNGTTFNVPYTYTILNTCTITDKKKNPNGDNVISFNYPGSLYYQLRSDKSVKEEFPELTQVNSIELRLKH
jgi:hypothetical protein